MNKHIQFIAKHIPFEPKNEEKALLLCQLKNVNDLVKKTIPSHIRRSTPLSITAFESEPACLQHLQEKATQNTLFTSHIGLGFYNTFTPATIQRNLFENPGWYTQYTPYQAEISQGRLEALLNFQTMICELTQLPIANASLLDEATAAAEAMIMLFRNRPRSQDNRRTLAIMHDCYVQTFHVVKTRAEQLGISLKSIQSEQDLDESIFAVLFQTPNRFGEHQPHTKIINQAKQQNIATICATDLLYLCFYDPPKNIDVCVGSSQRFGVPLGFGGPHAAFFACTSSFSRKIPGRIIGISTDKRGNIAYRMALQTREQHIRKEKATSNICTAQALLASMASMFAVYHGPKQLQNIASHVHSLATYCKNQCIDLGFSCINTHIFDTFTLKLSDKTQRNHLEEQAKKHSILLNLFHPDYVSIAFDETHNHQSVTAIIELLKTIAPKQPSFSSSLTTIPCQRPCTFMQQPVFNTYHSETELMRYMKKLENKDLSLTSSMIPLGSCTMKLNAAIEMMPLSFKEFSSIHPYAPLNSQQGYKSIIDQLGKWLCDITDLDEISFQPNSGAQGEYAGILAIKKYHQSNDNAQRTIALIPTSAHGTNPASAALAGLDIVPIKCDDQGNIDIADLTEKCTTYSEQLCLLMITYPSTHGVFEDNIQSICNLIHQHGGQVYMDGANLNAQVGLTSPGIIGADVCHINLHKTFAIPHGGGGPGMGPICVKHHLSPFLPQFSLDQTESCLSVAAAPFSSASILLISYTYIALMGGQGLTQASEQAILKANYIKASLQPYYNILYTGPNNTVAHELIIDCRPFIKQANITVEDIAKRLMDYSFHAPTVSWPVSGTLMIEPTESEPFSECDRFCEAMISIYHEIQDIAQNKADRTNNLLKNAPHTQQCVTDDHWPYPYSRKQATFPLDSLNEHKHWPTITRINQAKGDKQLICTCDTSTLVQSTSTT